MKDEVKTGLDSSFILHPFGVSMVQLCPRCQKANPEAAVFCWSDGVVLRQGAVPAALTLPVEFVFPSGRRCRTFDDLVQGCQYEWEDADVLLRRGELAGYLARIGRHDLAQAAAEAQAAPDPDIALYQFLDQLPVRQTTQGPRLDLHPRRLAIGPVRAGEQKTAALTVARQGTGLLQGRVRVSEGGAWLRILDGADGACAVKTGKSQQVGLQIDTRGLTPRSYSGKLTVVTNGGIAEVPVRLDVGTVPFPRGPFQGAASPRELAEKVRASPKQAVPLLENGEVARWFGANGWAYPVSGPPAKGLAAVQQLFEGMGLSKPPPLQLSESEMRFVCVPPEVAHGQVSLRTPAKKWVYGQAESDKPWLKVLTPAFTGPQQVPISFQIDSSLMDPDRVHQGTVLVTANAGQRLAVRVHVDVRSPHEPFTRRLLRPFLTGALAALAARLLLAAPADLFARGFGRPGKGLQPLPVAAWVQLSGAESAFLRPFVAATWWLGVVVALGLVWRRGGRGADLGYAGVAGAFAGLIGSATLGCVLLVCDALPHALLAHLTAAQPPAASPWPWLPLWVLLASLCWALAGGGLGMALAVLGRRGAALLAAVAAPIAWLFRHCGLKRAAAFFLVQG
jgi:hypothetical protein